MNCMKCGAETEDDHVFCASCLKEMEKYPVKPGISVQIPMQPPSPPPRKSRRKHHDVQYKSPKEKIFHLKGTIRILSIMLAGVFLAFCITAALLLTMLNRRRDIPLGQNYQTNASNMITSWECFT